MLSRRLGLFALTAALGAAGAPVAGAGAPAYGAALGRQLSRALKTPQVSQARTAAVAVDLVSGRVIFQQHGALSLAPASNEKLAVAYAALELLGPAFRTRTEVLGDGFRQGATWRGNLVLKGYGDAGLTRSDLRALARRLRALGIRRVTGRVLGDESFFDARRTAPGWRPSFFLTECEPLSALIVDRGRVGTRLSLEPAVAAASALSRALRSKGVAVAGYARAGPAPDNASPLAETLSPPLWKVLRFMNRESDNFTAEMLLKQLGAQYGSAGSTAAGAAVATSVLALDGIPLAGVRLVDGSGLSPRDRLTAQALVGILRAAWSSRELRGPFLGSLAVAGVYGTLRYRMTRPPLRGHVLGKTGTTNGSSALSGYVKQRFVFSVVSNGAQVASWWARQAQDRFVTRLARLQ